MKVILIGIFSALFLFSCVPQRKFLESENNLASCQENMKRLNGALDSMQRLNQGQIREYLEISKQLENVRRDSFATHKALDMQINAYENLSDVQQKTIANSEAENTKMLRELNKRSEELKAKEMALAEKESQIIASQSKTKLLSNSLVEREQKIIDLENALARKDSAVKALNANITKALTDYTKLGLSVKEKDGKVYVSLDEKLLFQSGSYSIDEKGRNVLLTVAKALNENPEVTIMIEGHTDNVPLSGKGVIKDNWDLSVLRATTIVKILVEEGKVDPKRVLAAGRGEFLPLDTSNTKEGRQLNRRTEIILTPKLSEILKSLE